MVEYVHGMDEVGVRFSIGPPKLRDMAQLVECSLRVREIPGSSPGIPTNRNVNSRSEFTEEVPRAERVADHQKFMSSRATFSKE